MTDRDGLLRLQKAALWLAVGAAILGILGGTGKSPFPAIGVTVAGLLHPVLFLVGGFAGWLAAGRSREIDRRRDEVLADDHLTKGEREWAHKDAESERNKAGAVFLAAAVLVAGAFSSHGRVGTAGLAGDLLPVTALAGFGAGLLAAALTRRRRDHQPSR